MFHRILFSYFFIFLTPLLISCSVSQPRKSKLDLPRGWYFSDYNSKINVTTLSERKKGYYLKINRQASDPEDQIYIELAESIYPNRNKILNEKNRKQILDSKKLSWYFERVWWATEHEKKLIPYSITADTLYQYIQYYKKFKKYLKKQRLLTEDKGDNRKRIYFEYKATVYREYEKVIVDLKMSWYQYCGLPCGWGFEMKRKVTFMNKNKVIEIQGDGLPEIWVSSPENQYGKEWFRF